MSQTILQDLSIYIPLTEKDRQIAREVSQEKADNLKVKQTYLNLLGILGIIRFLSEISCPIDVKKSRICNPVMRAITEPTDICIAGLSRVNCCRVLPNKKTYIAPEKVTQELFICHIFYEVQEQLNKVKLLGFIPALDPLSTREEIFLDELEPIDYLIDYLFDLEQGIEVLRENEKIAANFSLEIRSQMLAEIVAQFDRISELPLQQQVEQGTEILNLLIESNDPREGNKQLSREIIDELSKIWNRNTSNLSEKTEETKEEEKKKDNSSVKKVTFSLMDWLSEGIDEVAWALGWKRLEFQLEGEDRAFGHSKKLDSTKNDEQQNNSAIQEVFSRSLKIAGQSYELKVIPLNLKTDRSTWRFKLSNSIPWACIPVGFKLKLLTDTGEEFPGNEDVATTEQLKELYIDVTIEPGEGLIWLTEPMPDNYEQEVLCN